MIFLWQFVDWNQTLWPWLWNVNGCDRPWNRWNRNATLAARLGSAWPCPCCELMPADSQEVPWRNTWSITFPPVYVIPVSDGCSLLKIHWLATSCFKPSWKKMVISMIHPTWTISEATKTGSPFSSISCCHVLDKDVWAPRTRCSKGAVKCSPA